MLLFPLSSSSPSSWVQHQPFPIRRLKWCAAQSCRLLNLDEEQTSHLALSQESTNGPRDQTVLSEGLFFFFTLHPASQDDWPVAQFLRERERVAHKCKTSWLVSRVSKWERGERMFHLIYAHEYRMMRVKCANHKWHIESGRLTRLYKSDEKEREAERTSSSYKEVFCFSSDSCAACLRSIRVVGRENSARVG